MRIILSLYIVLLFIISCNQNDSINDPFEVKDCSNPIITGQIIELLEFDLNENVIFNSNFEYIIKNQNQFDSLIAIKDTNYNFPEINFDEQSLIGIYTSGTGCEITFDRLLNIDNQERIITYTIIIRSCGNCEKLGYSMNWAVIPKIEDEYSINFIINNQYL